jgi:hypothetical protein
MDGFAGPVLESREGSGNPNHIIPRRYISWGGRDGKENRVPDFWPNVVPEKIRVIREFIPGYFY